MAISEIQCQAKLVLLHQMQKMVLLFHLQHACCLQRNYAQHFVEMNCELLLHLLNKKMLLLQIQKNQQEQQNDDLDFAMEQQVSIHFCGEGKHEKNQELDLARTKHFDGNFQ